MNHAHPRRDGSGAGRFAWRHLYTVAIAAAVLLKVAFPLVATYAASNVFYLKGDGVPAASLSPSAPAATTLPNYDPGRDAFPGLLLAKSDQGINETDPVKYQLWVGSPTGVDLDGPASLTLWSAMKDFDNNKQGVVQAYLLDCTSAGTTCTLIDSASKTLDPWGGGSDSWISGTIDFGTVAYTVAEGRSLAVKLVVGDQSGDDMWFAYDTTAYSTRLTVQLGTPTTTSTTTATTTTTTVPPPTTTTTTTTTTVPLPTTTTTTTTTTTMVPPPATTTTVPLPTTTTINSTRVTPPTTTTLEPTTTTTTSEVPPATDPGGSTPGPEAFPSTTPNESFPPDQSAGRDIALAPLLESTEEETAADREFSSMLLDGLELVIPPAAAAAVLSPWLLLEAFVGAFTDAGIELLLPGLLLSLGAAWVTSKSRLRVLAGSRRSSQRGEKQ